MIPYTPIALSLSPAQTVDLQQAHTALNQWLEKALPIPHDLHSQLKQMLQSIWEAQEGWATWLADTYTPRVLHLQHPDSRILNLPWELALEEQAHLLLSKSPFPLAPAYKPDNPLPLKILVMVSSPEDSSVRNRLSFEEEELSILRACASLFETGQVQIDFTEDGSLANLRQKLHDNHYHILHFSGHGIYHEGQGYLELENPDTFQRQLCTAQEFAAALSANPEHLPALLLLSSCQTAQGGQDSNFSGVAQELLRAKVPAVLAMGWSILDHYANVFAEAFYQALANRVALPQAFRQALRLLEQIQNQDLAQRQIPGLASQWFIPQLYCQAAVDKIANLEKREKKLHLSPVQFQMKEHPAGYYFVGRREDKRRLLPALFAQQAIWLQGQGGLGKSSLCEHLVQRLLARHPAVQPFVLDENSADILALRGKLYDYFKKEHKRFTIEIDAQRYSEEAPKQVLWLLTELAQVCTPVFIFDNLESFQVDEGNPEFAEQHQALLELLHTLASNRLGYLLCTGRYPAPPVLRAQLLLHPLQEVNFVDFWKKTQQLRLVTLRQNLLQQQKVVPAQSPQLASYEDLIQWLHRTFGGNYRALEFFDEYFAQNPAKTSQLLTDLEQFPQLYQQETRAALQRMSANLVFERLLALLTPLELQTLGYLRHFRRPVLPLALSMQEAAPDYLPALQRLLDLTLIEEHSLDDAAELNTYYAAPLVKNLLAEADKQWPAFLHLKAGAYFEYVDAELNPKDYSDLEEAFEHYWQVADEAGLNRCGLHLGNSYYGANLFAKALHFSMQAFERIGNQTNWEIVNRAGLIFKLFGNYGTALQLYQYCLQKVQQIGDRSGEGTTLNNIAGIHRAKGDYDTALRYLEQSLAITQQIGDRSGEGTTLNNISQIHKVRGDYDRALRYLEQSLAIQQQIGDRFGEGTTLNNISQIYSAKGDYDTALRYLEQSLAIQQQIGDRSGEGTTLNNISQIHEVRGDYDTALRYLEQSLAITQQIGDRSGEGRTLNNISQIHKVRGDYDTALRYLEQSLAIRQQIGDRSGLCAALHNMACIYLVQKDDAEKYLELEVLAYQTAQEIGDVNAIYQVGWYLGGVLCQYGAAEHGLPVLQKVYQLGLQVGYPDVEKLGALIRQYGG